METFDANGRRFITDRRLSMSPIDIAERRSGIDRRGGRDRRCGTDRRSPNGFRALAGLGRRKRSSYPPLFYFYAPPDSVLWAIHTKEN
jgi:hypothetical protein